MPFCENCGNEISDTAKFCPKCGFNLKGGQKLDIFNKENQISSSPTTKREQIILSAGKRVENTISDTKTDKTGKESSISDKRKSSNSGSSSHFWSYVFWIAVIIMGAIYYSYNSSNSTKGATNTNYSGDPSVNNSLPKNELENIKIDPTISAEVDSSALVEQFSIDKDLKTNIKKILSDPNPDPENKSGTVCGQSEIKCKWCGKSFYVDNTCETIQSEISPLFSSMGDIGSIYMGVMDKFSGGTENQKLVNELQGYCTSYENGDKYVSVPENRDFCSEKCKTEYGLYHQ